jgi:diguanylate cyclase (GGDEF)-like protein
MPEDKKSSKILIVDDNKQNIDLLMELFKEDYKIAAAITPERALKIAGSDAPPDIILLDIIMPGMDGYEVCAQLKQEEKTKDIPIIFITAVSEVMDEAKGFALGAVDYITKPFHPPMVKARVEMQLDLRHKQKLLEEYAFLDSLTEIPNRRHFDKVVQKEWNRAKRSGRPLSLVLLDIDHFKEYNDTYGHGQGDKALFRVAQKLQKTLQRAGDFIARYGGEEFAAVLPYTDKEKALELTKYLNEAVASLAIEHTTSRVADHLTVSIGVLTVSPSDSMTLQSALEEVDQAMYLAKTNGRNRTEYAL